MTSIEADVREIKESIRALTEKIDALLHERETLAMMKLSEQSLSTFLSEEPDLYTVREGLGAVDLGSVLTGVRGLNSIRQGIDKHQNDRQL